MDLSLTFRSPSPFLLPKSKPSTLSIPLISLKPSPHRLTVAAAAGKMKMIEGVSDELNSIASQNLDYAAARRRVRSAFIPVHQQLDHLLFKMAPTGVRTEEVSVYLIFVFFPMFMDVKGSLFCFGYGNKLRLSYWGIAFFRPHFWGFDSIYDLLAKIADDVTPSKPVLNFLTFLSKVMPTAKLVPQKDLAELMFRDPRKKKMAVYNVICYDDRVRLRTAVELLNATKEIEEQVDKVSSPLLILHGAADKVTDPVVSQFLYENASSKDKTLKLYEEGYHCILEGEPDDRILTVLNDIISWLDARC
ncbi:hypothetical protein GOBAR_DD02389 [Gossypium barbadense]|nr:hypothetical protein GOBAR_DD02389 [Gossypium barbadense]